jgi:hypothetical protein
MVTHNTNKPWYKNAATWLVLSTGVLATILVMEKCCDEHNKDCNDCRDTNKTEWRAPSNTCKTVIKYEIDNRGGVINSGDNAKINTSHQSNTVNGNNTGNLNNNTVQQSPNTTIGTNPDKRPTPPKRPVAPAPIRDTVYVEVEPTPTTPAPDITEPPVKDTVRKLIRTTIINISLEKD